VTPDEFDATFDSFEHTAHRLQTRDSYLADDEVEDFRRFLEGLPLPEWSVRTSPWLRRVAETTAAGRRWQRVQLVDEPLTDYLRFELTSFACGNVEAGEDIRVARRDTHPALARLHQDFWVFDVGLPTAFVVFTHYDAEGRLTRFERSHDHAVVTRCAQEYDLALANSALLREYLATVVA